MLLPLLMNLGMFTAPVTPTIPDGTYGYSTDSIPSGLTYVASVPDADLTYVAGVPSSDDVYIVEA